MEQLREMASIILVTIPLLRAGYYRPLPLIVQPPLHTNNRWGLNDGLFHARALSWQSDSHRKLSLLTWANPARCSGSQAGALHQGCSSHCRDCSWHCNGNNPSPPTPVRNKPAPKEALLSWKGHRMFKLWQTLIWNPAASPPQGPWGTSCRETFEQWLEPQLWDLAKKRGWFLKPCGFLMHFLHRHCPEELFTDWGDSGQHTTMIKKGPWFADPAPAPQVPQGNSTQQWSPSLEQPVHGLLESSLFASPLFSSCKCLKWLI